MEFVSYGFAMFVAVCTAACLLGGMVRPVVLFVASAAFLWIGGGLRNVFWYGVSAASVWYGALLVEKYREGRAALSRIVFVAVLVMNMGILAVFRYINFPGYTMEELFWLTGKELKWTPVVRAAPAAISFYTLTLAGYLVEVYWGTQRPEKNLMKLALFGGFFPQMAVGPIARYGRLSKTLFEKRTDAGREVLDGMRLILWGLFKKLVIAERLAVLVDTVYGDYAAYSGSFLILAAVCFPFQLYTDFGGAADIALGTAQLFGVRLEQNFLRPFYSRSVAEFWRRWHVTLGGWFRDFVMYPMLKTAAFQRIGDFGRKRFGKRYSKKIPTVAALAVVWFLLGLWHGGKWTFIIGSGLYHAVLMSLGLLVEPVTAKMCRGIRLDREHPLWAAFQRVRTFVLVAVGFVFFRSDSLKMAAGVFSGMCSGNMGLFGRNGLVSLGLGVPDLAVLAVSMGVLWMDSMEKERESKAGASGQEPSDPEKMWLQEVLACLCLGFCVLIFGCYGRGYDPAAFIYTQF